MKRVLIVGCLSLIFILLGAAEKDRLAVMDVQDEAKLFNKKTINNVTDYIFTKLQGTKIYWMIQKADRDTALEQAIEETVKGSRKECVDEKCQLSLVAQLQANFLINTKIKKLYEGTCNISISKFDVEKRAGVDSWEEKFNCTEKGLYQAIDSFYFGASKKEGAAFQTGKMGKLEDEWTPDMAGTGERVVVYFESDPVGATISIDGKVEGATPDVNSRLLASGKHQIKMEKEGFYTESKIIDVKKGDKINFKLLPGITINSNPQGAMVKIDGKLTCQTTPCQRVVDEGQREIVTQKELYATKTQMINVQRGKDIKIDLDPDFGWLEIKSPYGGVDVFLDGKNVGKTPIQKMQITPGPHLIEPKGNCFNTVPEQIIVEKLRVKSVNLSIQQKSAAIEVYSKDDKGNDIEADVYVDGKNVGTSPGTFPVSVCSKEVTVKAKKGEFTQNLILQEKKVTIIDALFQSPKVNQLKKSGEITIVKFDTEPPDATIIVDGDLLCTKTPCSKAIPIGEYNVVIQKENYQKKENVINIEKGMLIKIKLEPIPKNTFDTGKRSDNIDALKNKKTPEKFITDTSKWSKKAPKEMNRSDAKSYCADLSEDGYSDWRLPAISELRTLIKNCPATETGGACKVTNECLHYGNCKNDACGGCSSESDGRYSKLGDTGWFWSLSEASDAGYALGVYFKAGRVDSSHKGIKYSVRCVR